MFKYVCCAEFDVGGLCIYCNEQRKLRVSEPRWSKFLNLSQELSEITDSIPEIGPELFRLSILIADPHYKVLIRNFRKRLPLKKYSQQLVVAEQQFAEVCDRIKRAGIPRVRITANLKEILLPLVDWVGDSGNDQLDVLVHKSLRQAALIILGRAT